MTSAPQSVAFVVAVIVLGGTLLSNYSYSGVADVQVALLAEIYGALTNVITPISSLSGAGLSITTETFTSSSANGPWPLLILILAGLIVGIIATINDGNIESASLSAFLGSTIIVSSWLLLGFVVMPLIAAGEPWYVELDRAFSTILYARPLELPAVVLLPVIAALPISLAINYFLNVRRTIEEEVERQPSLFPWRQKRKT